MQQIKYVTNRSGIQIIYTNADWTNEHGHEQIIVCISLFGVVVTARPKSGTNTN